MMNNMNCQITIHRKRNRTVETENHVVQSKDEIEDDEQHTLAEQCKQKNKSYSRNININYIVDKQIYMMSNTNCNISVNITINITI